MMRPVQKICFFVSCQLVILIGCNRNPMEVDTTGIRETVLVERFDRELFEMDMDTLEEAIGYFYDSYGDFFDIFNVHIIRIGPGSGKRYPSYLSMFVNDPANREVYQYTGQVFSDMEQVNRKLTDGFRHYLYHFPDSTLPRVVGYVSRFNHGLFTVDRFIGVGLDQYLGSDCPYYEQMGIPRYLTRNKIPEKIPADVLYARGTRICPYNDSVDNLLTRIIHQGMLLHFLDAMFPRLEDSLKTGFTAAQLEWCRKNEKQMWTHLVEQKLLFSGDPLVIRKFVDDAPYTSYFTGESPGRAAVWLGRQIVREYAGRHPQRTLSGLMTRRDYYAILRESRYDP